MNAIFSPDAISPERLALHTPEEPTIRLATRGTLIPTCPDGVASDTNLSTGPTHNLG